LQAARIRFLNPPGERNIRDNNVNGITASPASAVAKDGKRKLYYSPLTSLSLFEGDLDAFKDEAIATNAKSLHSHVKEYKSKLSPKTSIIIACAIMIHIELHSSYRIPALLRIGIVGVSVYN
jgi:hypothetical protein